MNAKMKTWFWYLVKLSIVFIALIVCANKGYYICSIICIVLLIVGLVLRPFDKDTDY